MITIPEPKSLLHGERLQLTPLSADDLPVLARWQQDTVFLRLYDAVPAYPKGDRALAAWLDERHKDPSGYLFALRLIEDRALIGMAELDGILWAHRVCGLSIAIGDAAYRGQGYGTEAMRLLLAFAFDELNLHRVQLTVFSYNRRAIALYEKLGFQFEGTFREFLQRDGQRHDMLLYGLLRREWAAGVAPFSVQIPSS
jgi:RimJ/RimL family protein N-acetyltransferase